MQSPFCLSLQNGKVVLYQLENRPKQLWLCRIKVPNGSGYLYRGTGTSDLYEARKFADSLLDDLKIKVKMGVAITGKDFKKVFEEFSFKIGRHGGRGFQAGRTRWMTARSWSG